MVKSFSMSGGEFDYNQYNIKDIAERLEVLLERQGKEVAGRIDGASLTITSTTQKRRTMNTTVR